ncbi:uncharacterized protein N7483_011424 [Penicillium malachiteum]|uniref:uncharacterized protein n=1 Tax=Penicillium malachiteum TaxID=1324776 RepID=UPI00254870F1|nr:uncharacterized protein N7483_011424 [Penicillium malachiteum]KAJ5714243.1 hypothetical protein N7483_011424 [Penicillium malachiteum]
MASAEIPPENTDDFGDVVDNFNDEAELEEYAEPWCRYDIEDNPDVLYPIYLGEILNERYLIEHKLGFGGGSTGWHLTCRRKKDVALKGMALGEWADNEAGIQDEVIKSVQDTSHLVLATDTFLGPRDDQSYHRVLVFPMKGPSIRTFALQKTPMAARISAAKQILETVASLHDAGIMHRDLNARNCMWGIKSTDGLSRTAKYELLGRPLKETIPCVDLWKKGELVSNAEVPDDFRTDEFYLCDFGLAKKVGDLSTQSGYPPAEYCSSERFHRHEPSFACDMWSYMAIFGMLYIAYPPFFKIDGGIISNMVQTLGPLPEKWKDHSNGVVHWMHGMSSLWLRYILVAWRVLWRKLLVFVLMLIPSSGNLRYRS